MIVVINDDVNADNDLYGGIGGLIALKPGGAGSLVPDEALLALQHQDRSVDEVEVIPGQRQILGLFSFLSWLPYLLRSSTVSTLAKRCPDFFVPTNLPLSALKVTAPSSSQLRSSKAALARRVSPAWRPPPACKLNKRS